MSSSEEIDADVMSDDSISTLPELQNAARAIKDNLLPPKSKNKYLKTYETFIQWMNETNSKSFSENVFLAYFGELSKKLKPTTLWVTYSMLKCTVAMKHKVDLKHYKNLTSLLKRQSYGYKSEKSKALTTSNVKQFLNEAPDGEYLAAKVALIFGIYGACRCNEIINISVKDVESHDGLIVVTKRDSKTKFDFTFVIREEFAEIVKKYIAMRPPDLKTERFFLNFKNNKCLTQVIGRHKIAAMPKIIATYLKLRNPEQYTGYCYRRTSGSFLADTGTISTPQRHSGGSELVTRSNIEGSMDDKSNIIKISEIIYSRSPSEEHQMSDASSSHQGSEVQDYTEEKSIDEQQILTSLEFSHTNFMPGKANLTFNNCTFNNCTFN